MFAHLHVHTEYSLLDGSNKIREYVARVKELGMTAAAITDHGVMYGCIDFYRECKKQGIHPVLGCEVYVSPGSMQDREAHAGDDRYYHLILLAENDTGFANLTRIVSAGFVDGFYYKPRVDKELLRKYHEGIICTSACLAGEVARNLSRGSYDGAVAAAKEYRDIFGENNFFLELQDHGIPEQRHVNRQLVRMHDEEGFPLICTNDCHYTLAEDAEPHDILLCLQTGKKVSDEDRMRYEGGQYYVKSPEEMAALFRYVPEALENTGKIAERCQVEIAFGERKLPRFDVPAGYDSWTYLNHLCEEGLRERYADITPKLRERLNYELATIRNMGFVDYFLIVWDYVKFARDHGIAVGPGRGSAAGSVVSYTLGITDLDPIRYDLIFERFLNPERVSMPDIDMDFCYERRQEVIDYVIKKYTPPCVCQIITFGTMQARGVIRDVARVLDLSYAAADEIAKMIPKELNITLDKALEMNPDLKKRYTEEEQVRYLIDMARRLEGLPRNTSIHAAGVVICGRPVVDYVPLSRGADGVITTQYTMTTLEELGLLKMDFLGLRTLTVIQDAVDLVNRKKTAAGEPLLDMREIDYNDPKVMDMISRGKCEGIFQLESAGMKAFMKQLKPRTLEDIIAGISLYRPGPMDFIPKYIAGKEDPAAITYDCEEMRPILEKTYGCIVYQEQVMQIVRDLGGYSFGRSDLIRRAMSKKKADVMAKERQNFVYGNKEMGVGGCRARGISESVANHIFDEMTDFASYAFNKSHAAAYAVVSFRTAYLKYYHPVEFMAALMTSVIEHPDKCAAYILHCKDMNIPILPPSVNSGFGRFTTEGNAIRYGMYAIRSAGRGVIDRIVEEREIGGPFRSLADFVRRMNGRDLNKRAVENLIKAGALDDFPGSRRQKVLIYPTMMDQEAAKSKNSMAGQMTFLDFLAPDEQEAFEVPLPKIDEYPKAECLAYEKEVLGVYLSGHPLEEYRDVLKRNTTNVTTDFLPDEDSGEPLVTNGARVRIGGMISAKTIKYTRNNQVMAFVTIEDLLGTVEVLVFPKSFERYRDLLEEDNKVIVEGRVSAEDERPWKLICDKVTEFSSLPRAVWIAFSDRGAYEAKKKILTETVAAAEPGIDRVVAFLKSSKGLLDVTGRRKVSAGEELITALRGDFGEENVAVLADRPKLFRS